MMDGSRARTEESLSPWRRRLATGCVTLGVGVTLLDQTAANVLLPTLAESFGTTASASVLAVNVFQLTLAVSLVPLGALGSRIGYRKVYLCGLLLTLLCALGAAFSPSMAILTVFRGLQGVAAAAIFSVNLALVRHIVPDHQFGRAVGFNTMVVALGAACGPVVGGFIAAALSWHWVFGLAAPIAALAFLAGFATLPTNELSRERMDIKAMLLSITTFGSLIGAFILGGQGAAAWQTGAVVLLGCLACVRLVRRESVRPDPLFPVDILRMRGLPLALLTSVCAYIIQMLVFVAMPFHAQSTLDYGVAETGLLFAVWPIALALAGPLGGILSDRHQPALVAAAGMTFLGAGVAFLGFAGSGPASIGLAMALCGFGFGLFQTPNNKVLITGVPRRRSGAASSAIGTARIVGQSAGAALAAAGLSLAGTPIVFAGAAIMAAVTCALCIVRGRRAG